MVTFDIEPVGDIVKLTVVHDGFELGGVVAGSISGGWPRVISGLKTLLETDQALRDPRFADRRAAAAAR
jgi:hypothetical protein